MAEVALAAHGQFNKGVWWVAPRSAWASHRAARGSTDARGAARGAPRLLRGASMHWSRDCSDQGQIRENPKEIVSVSRCMGIYRA